MYRLFVAVALRENTEAHLDELVDAARVEVGREFRPVPRGKRHVTLCFIGDTDPANIDDMSSDLGREIGQVDAFEMVVEGAGAFPKPERARVFWAGVRAGARRLVNLSTRITDVLQARHDHRPENRPFHPHITLGRVRGRHVDLSDVIRAHEHVRWGIDPVAEVHLLRSQLHPDGARYTVLERFPLMKE